MQVVGKVGLNALLFRTEKKKAYAKFRLMEFVETFLLALTSALNFSNCRCIKVMIH